MTISANEKTEQNDGTELRAAVEEALRPGCPWVNPVPQTLSLLPTRTASRPVRAGGRHRTLCNTELAWSGAEDSGSLL